MPRNNYFKFLSLSLGNLRKLLTVNLLLFVPVVLLLFTLYRLLPALVHYVDTLNVSVSDVAPGQGKLALVFVWGGDENGPWKEDTLYVFRKRDFNSLRKHIFMSRYSGLSLRLLEERSLARGRITGFKEAIPLYSKSGDLLLTVEVKGMREGSIEFFFFGRWQPLPKRMVVLYPVLAALSFVLLGGAFGGITDYTQRVVFHEMKGFPFLLLSIRRNFLRSVAVSFFMLIVLGAVAANIYFYIFMLSTDVSVFIAALNFWMLVFFLIALLWAYPLMILNRNESLFKVVKKSLYISFDNLEYTGSTLFLLLAMGGLSLCTLSLFPGVAGGFSFLNNALKDLSARYTKPDTT